jgi:hypothetical protein
MSNPYSVDVSYNAMPGNSVDDKLHRRGEGPLAPTKGNHQRRYGFVNKEIFQNSFKLFLIVLVMSSSLALAHEGFNFVLNDVVVNPYTVTVLEDTHVTENQTKMNVMIQVAHGREAAPADTKVRLKLEHENKIVYDNDVKYVGSSSSDGRTFYAYYVVTIPVSEMGMHQATLELDGSLGNAKTNFQFDVKLAPNFRAVELIPSLLIMGICLAGLALFVISARTPAQKTPNIQKGLRHA